MLILLAIVIAAPLPQDPLARARALVHTCEAVRIASGVGFRCAGALVQLSSAPGTDEQGALDTQLETIRASMPGVGPVVREDFKIEGGVHPAARFRVSESAPQTPGLIGIVVAYAPPNDQVVRTVSCLMPYPEASMTARCEAILAGLAAVGPGPFMAGEARLPPPKFLGKEIRLPKGCTASVATDDGFHVTCADKTSLAYVKKASDADAQAARSFLRADAEKDAGATAKAGPCTIGGVKTECDVVRGPDTVVRLGVAKAADTLVVASCTQPLKQKGVHPLCAQVMKF